MRRVCWIVALALAGVGLAHAQAASTGSGQAWPVKPVRIMVGYVPGGGVDTTARIVAAALTEHWGSQVIVENRPGAAGNIATEITAKAAPDGYTLLVGASGQMTINPVILPKHPYDTVRDFAAITTLAQFPMVIAVNPSFPAKSIAELIALARAKPGELAYSHGGATHQVAAEMFNHMSGMKMLVVVYKGGFPALVDVMGGQAQVNLGSLIQTLPHMSSGRVRALATSGAKRAAAAPDLPTIAEAGVTGYEANNFWIIGAPAKTPPAVINKLSAEMTRYLKLPETLKRFEAEGVETDILTPAGVRRMLPVEIAKWRNVAKMANIRTE